MARQRRRPSTGRDNKARNQRRGRSNDGLIPVLAQAVRQVEHAITNGDGRASVRTKFQVVALLTREERARIIGDDSTSEAYKTEQLKRLDGIATILAKTAARDASLLALIGEGAELTEFGKLQREELLEAAGIEEKPKPAPKATDDARERQVVPQSVLSRQLANPFLAPEFDVAAQQVTVRPQRLAGWELLGPLLRAFEEPGSGAVSCMKLPSPFDAPVSPGIPLMKHQAEVVAAAAKGHRTFLLADEPGLGKTAQALLSAEATGSYPLLAVVPNVVKTNWAREVGLWTPNRSATVIHSDGDTVDGFADVVIVNYEILDRHLGWLGDFGFRAMVVDEAHFIKNKSSQRSQHVLHLSSRIRKWAGNPLLFALTGTPLINDIEDFLAIWEYLGWIDATKPIGELMRSLENTGLTPADPGFFPAARQCVIDRGIVRRAKIDVASDIAARRVADLPVELDGATGRSIRQAQDRLIAAMLARYDAAGVSGDDVDVDVVRRVASWARKEDKTGTTDNVFTVMRQIGQAKSELAADYAAQLVRNVGKVVFFAKHIDVMDSAEALFASRGIGYISIRGNQTSKTRQRNIDAFTNDPDVAVAVCSLSAAGVGLNLQVASNLVLAELPWTQADQTQAIDRVHRIGQEQPVTAWRVLATHTIDTKVAELIDRKGNLAAVALDGATDTADDTADVALEALVAVLTEALEIRRT